MTTLKKILVIGEKQSGKLTLIKALTGTLPSDIASDSHGGLTHELQIKNTYYSATVGIWLDEFAANEVETFCASYASDEAIEVRDSLNVLILCFRLSDGEDRVRHVLENVKKVADRCSPETVLLAVGTNHHVKSANPETTTAQSTSTTEAVKAQDDYGSDTGDSAGEPWDDVCLDEGFEYIDLQAQGKNTFGEAVGIKRALDAIEACDWSDTATDPSEEELLAEMMAEDATLNEKLLSLDAQQQHVDPSEASVEDLENMMQRVMMAREHLQDLTPAQRKSQAAKLVAEIMKT